MSTDDIEELHKWIAHPTTREVTHGSVAYEIYDFSHAALEQMLAFFDHVSTSFFVAGSPRSTGILAAANALRRLWDEWTGMVEPGKQKQL